MSNIPTNIHLLRGLPREVSPISPKLFVPVSNGVQGSLGNNPRQRTLSVPTLSDAKDAPRPVGVDPGFYFQNSRDPQVPS